MPVDGHGERLGGVPERLGNDRGMDPGLHHRRGRGMAEVGLVDAPAEELIALSRTVHGYDGAPDQAEGYEAALNRIGELYEDAERRWEARERRGERWEEAREWRGEVVKRPELG